MKDKIIPFRILRTLNHGPKVMYTKSDGGIAIFFLTLPLKANQ